MNQLTKKEIPLLYESYRIVPATKDKSVDKDLAWLVNNLCKAINCERPDAYLVHDSVAFCIEHSRISIYKHNDKGDIKQASSNRLCIRDNTGSLKSDFDCIFEPSLSNLILSLAEALSNHMRHSNEYKENVKSILSLDNQDYQYRLILLLEDQSISASYINNESTIPINPLLLDSVANELLKYRPALWGVIYLGGDVKTKTIYAYTLDEIMEKKEMGELLKSKDYRTLIDDESIHISEDDFKKDVHTVTIRLTDHS